MYISWATNVNKIIEDSTKITVGDGATVEDGLEAGGQKKKRLVCANPPDKYQITMNFNCVDKGADGYTELERFYVWYKYIHCYGVHPFEFPAILINSNRMHGESQEDINYIIQRIAHGDTSAKLPDVEYYIITSAVEGGKSGNDQQITMTWETYATGAFTIPESTSAISRIQADFLFDNSTLLTELDVILTSTPPTEPTPNTWQIYYQRNGGEWQALPSSSAYSFFDGDKTARFIVWISESWTTLKFKVENFESNTLTV